MARIDLSPQFAWAESGIGYGLPWPEGHPAPWRAIFDAKALCGDDIAGAHYACRTLGVRN
jgi:hypothetical protein